MRDYINLEYKNGTVLDYFSIKKKGETSFIIKPTQYLCTLNKKEFAEVYNKS